MDQGLRRISVVIWGTGGQAGGVINYNSGWLVNVDIVCFVNNSHKTGTEELFYGKNVISPVELKEKDFDYILILSSYIEEISKQIIFGLGIPVSKIITIESLAEISVKRSGTSIINKKVLLYGKKYSDFNYIYHIQKRTSGMEVVYCTGGEKITGFQQVNICEINKHSYDYILFLDHNNTEREELYNYLIQAGNVPKDKILYSSQWLGNLAYEHNIINNDTNQFYYCIIPRPHDGLMGLLLEFLRTCDYASRNNYIPFIDMQYSLSLYMDGNGFGNVNVWENFFSQVLCVGNKSIPEIYKECNVVIPSMYVRTNRYRNIYEKKSALKAMQGLYKKYFHMDAGIKEVINQKRSEVFKGIRNQPVMGCIYRGTDYTSIKPANHMVQPDIEEFIYICDAKRKEWGCGYIYIATEDADALEKCKEHFGQMLLYTDQLRYSGTGNKFLAQIDNARENDRYLRGIEYITAIVLFDETDYLVSGQNGAFYGTLLLKENDFKDMYVFDKGKYAVTNNKYV